MKQEMLVLGDVAHDDLEQEVVVAGDVMALEHLGEAGDRLEEMLVRGEPVKVIPPMTMSRTVGTLTSSGIAPPGAKVWTLDSRM